jgi:hypothetical protein
MVMCDWRVLFLGVMGAFFGCEERPGATVGRPLDARRADGVCPVHGGRMETVEVRVSGGCVLYSREYVEARAASFPYAGSDDRPVSDSSDVGLIHVCAGCEAAREEWNRGRAEG